MWRCLFHLVFRTSLLLTAITSGVMWAAPEDFLVRSWHSEDGLPSNNVRSIAQSTDGYLWVATAEGVVRFDGVRFSAVGDARDEALFRAPRAVFALPDGSVWIATRRGGLLRWRHGHSSLVWQGADEEPTTGQIIREVFSDGAGGAFLLSEDTTFHAQGDDPPRALSQTPEWQHRIDQARHSAPRAVSASTEGPLELVDQHQRRWMRTAEGGLAVLSPGQDSAVVLAEFTTSNRVMALMEDREGNVWAATNGGGLRQIRERRVTILDATEGNAERHFITVMEDREGQVWAANKTGGISRIRPGHLDSFPLGNREPDRNVSAMVEDAEGNLWVSKNNGAMFRREGEHFTAANGESPVFRRIMAMTKDAKGHLWLGGHHGNPEVGDGASWLGPSVVRPGFRRRPAAVA